jgi:hypothetical protein
MLWDCKDSLVKLRALPCGLPDTYVYYELDKLKQQVPESLAQVRAKRGAGGGARQGVRGAGAGGARAS